MVGPLSFVSSQRHFCFGIGLDSEFSSIAAIEVSEVFRFSAFANSFLQVRPRSMGYEYAVYRSHAGFSPGNEEHRRLESCFQKFLSVSSRRIRTLSTMRK